MKEMSKKVANNILEFLLDPTVIPVRQRLYFRPEENLQNQVYEGAKADARAAYRTQGHNSDFYPSRNRQQREASYMDRRTLIASLDVLAQNFSEEDPIGTNLRGMALTVSKMSDEELTARTMKTFKCPECGTKVLEQTKYCVKCKKKVEPPKGKEAAMVPPEPEKKPDDEAAEADACVKGNWNKQATEAVRRGLLAEVFAGDMKPEEDLEEKEADQNSPHPQLEKKAPAVEAKKVPEPEAPAAAPAPAATPAPAPVPEAKEPEKKEETEVEAKKVVDTDILVATQKYAGVDITAGMMTAEDVGELTVDEKARLDQLFS